MLKTFKFRIYPNLHQIEDFAAHFGCTRWVYNWALEHRSSKYEFENCSVSCYDLIRLLPVLKEQNPWLRFVNSQSLQQSIRHLDVAYNNFFEKRCKYPRFKSKYSKQSFTVPQNCKVDFDNNLISLPKIKNIKAKLHKHFTGKIKTATVLKHQLTSITSQL